MIGQCQDNKRTCGLTNWLVATKFAVCNIILPATLSYRALYHTKKITLFATPNCALSLYLYTHAEGTVSPNLFFLLNPWIYL